MSLIKSFLGLFKTDILLMSTDDQISQDIKSTQIESYTVEWRYKTGWCDDTNTKIKVFTDKDTAKDYEKYLEDCAEAIGCWLSVHTYKND